MKLRRLREFQSSGTLNNDAVPVGAYDPHDDLPVDLQSRLPVRVDNVRLLGQGRAARAVLVDATMSDGQVVRCVEKIFAPGRLTRIIYRLSFQAPFAYQQNIHAILASFYRRRVAAAAIRASDGEAEVARPLYVRFDRQHRAWVLAAEWIDGRGIRPVAAGSKAEDDENEPEINQILRTMRSLESIFAECGLVGSGWQVAPSAMVSTANLLRTGDHYTVIDLESGIPAVLVPKYLMTGLRYGCIPPFDDLAADQLAHWIEANERQLTFRLGSESLKQLASDAQNLIEHHRLWKDSEVAIARKPGRWFRHGRIKPYQAEYIRQLVQDQKLCIPNPSITRLRMMWWAGCVPTRLGAFLQQLIGHPQRRAHVMRLLREPASRSTALHAWVRRSHGCMVSTGRLPKQDRSTQRVLMHALLGRCLPITMHRYFSDGELRKQRRRQIFLLAVSPTYQAWFGEDRITRAIEKWVSEKRLDGKCAEALLEDLSGDLVRTYVRGFGLHFALKGLAPLWVPIKLAGTAAFLTTGNWLYLAPFLITPALRLAVTVQSWWSQPSVPHREAMWLGCLPVLGLIAFPMQMFATQPRLSTFMIRDVAAKLGQRLPIYGGKDSRTEIACIRAADYLIVALVYFDKAIRRMVGATETSSHRSLPPRMTIKTPNRFRRWVRRLAQHEIKRQTSLRENGTIAEERQAA